jgi:hypothetical protein
MLLRKHVLLVRAWLGAMSVQAIDFFTAAFLAATFAS